MEVQDLVAALIEGRVHSLMIVAEVTDENGNKDWIKGFDLDMDENVSDDFAFVGAVTMALRELQDEIMMSDFEVSDFDLGDDDDDDEFED